MIMINFVQGIYRLPTEFVINVKSYNYFGLVFRNIKNYVIDNGNSPLGYHKRNICIKCNVALYIYLGVHVFTTCKTSMYIKTKR